MRLKDGGLRTMLRERLPVAQWTSVESPLTGSGIPDCEYCYPGGVQGWVECKVVRSGWKPKFRPGQVAWISRRARLGGRVFIAVRRQIDKGGDDDLWLVPGTLVMVLEDHGLRGLDPSGLVRTWVGGPSMWDWGEVGDVLRGGVATQKERLT